MQTSVNTPAYICRCILFRRKSFMYKKVKRGLELLTSILLLVIIIPICLIACIFIVLESSGNPIYIQERVVINSVPCI